MKCIAAALLILLTACAQADLNETNGSDELHGTAPAESPNLPGERGALDVTGSMVAYHGDVEGYLAQPVVEGSYPGVVMVHEWWGLNDNIKAMAHRLASEGYAVLAVDLYEGEVATTPDRARELVSSFDQGRGLENMRSAMSYLRALGSPTIASIGWCFGGGQSLQLGLAEDLDATIIYYGQPVADPEVLDEMEQPVLGIFGATDQSISVESVQQFDTALDSAGIENEIIVYPGVGHAFANPSGDNYDAQAAEQAWAETISFLEENLR